MDAYQQDPKELTQGNVNRRIQHWLDWRGSVYGIFLLLFLGMCYLIAIDVSWPIGIFIFILLTAVLELTFRLWESRENIKELQDRIERRPPEITR